METETLTKDLEDEVDLDSFMEAEMEEQETESGMARLTSVERISESDEIPAEYCVLDRTSEGDILLFDGVETGTDENIKIAVRTDESYSDWDLINAWTGRNKVSSLAGCKVPIQEVTNRHYKIPNFKHSFLESSTPNEIKRAVDLGVVEYEDGEWVKSERMHRHDEVLDKIEKYSELGVWGSALLMFVMSGSIALFFAIMTVTMFVITSYAHTRQKPIKSIVKNV